MEEETEKITLRDFFKSIFFFSILFGTLAFMSAPSTMPLYDAILESARSGSIIALTITSTFMMAFLLEEKFGLSEPLILAILFGLLFLMIYLITVF